MIAKYLMNQSRRIRNPYVRPGLYRICYLDKGLSTLSTLLCTE